MKEDDERKIRIAKATEVLLAHTGENWLAVTEAVQTLLEIFGEITDIRGRQDGIDCEPDLHLEQGMALAPDFAAHCLVDLARTARYLQGVHGAIIEAARKFPGQPLHVVYAGCGPYALLFLPLTSCFSPQQVRVTLLDCIATSLESAKKLFTALGLEEYVVEAHLCNAAAYRHTGEPFQVLVTETMQRALDKEPQVAITLNLVPQMEEGGILVPREVKVSAALVDPKAEAPVFLTEGECAQGILPLPPVRERCHLADLFSIRQDNCLELSSRLEKDDQGEAAFPAVRITLPEEPGDFKQLRLLTTITLYGDITLKDNDSGLTCPLVLMDLDQGEYPRALEFRYTLGSHPGLRHRSFW